MPLAPPPNRGHAKRFRILQTMCATQGASAMNLRELCRLMRTPEIDLASEATALEKLAADPKAWLGSTIPWPRVEQTMIEGKPVVCACPGWVADEAPRTWAPAEVNFQSDGNYLVASTRKV